MKKRGFCHFLLNHSFCLEWGSDWGFSKQSFYWYLWSNGFAIWISGHRLKGYDVKHAGVATHFVTSEKVLFFLLSSVAHFCLKVCICHCLFFAFLVSKWNYITIKALLHKLDVCNPVRGRMIFRSCPTTLKINYEGETKTPWKIIINWIMNIEVSWLTIFFMKENTLSDVNCEN